MFKKSLIVYCVVQFFTCVFVFANSPCFYKKLPGDSLLSYHPEGGAIVKVNGKRWNNRPLYCDQRKAIFFAGEQPMLSGPAGKLLFAVKINNKVIFLNKFQRRKMYYYPGRMLWELEDSTLADTKISIEATTIADATGCTVKAQLEGKSESLEFMWCFIPPQLPGKKSYVAKMNEDGFNLKPDTVLPFRNIAFKCSHPIQNWQQTKASYIDPTPNFWGQLIYWYNESGEATNQNTGLEAKELQSLSDGLLDKKAVFASCKLHQQSPLFINLMADDFDQILIMRTANLDTLKLNNPPLAFTLGKKRVDSIAASFKINTPDKYLNAAVPAAAAAVMGLFVRPTFVHGGSAWRYQLSGWRTMGAATDFGMHNLVKQSVDFWATQMIKNDTVKVKPAVSESGCQQDGKKSIVFGNGFMDYHQPFHYEFQTQFFDEAVRQWRATADATYEKKLMPLLELHLLRCKKSFDPDGDGLYESYINTWPTDSQWYNGGGTVEQSAYMYYGFKALSEMKRKAGFPDIAKQYEQEAASIKASLNKILWLNKRGHYAAYIEQGGLKRVHHDAWVYSEHLPIEAGMANLKQAWQAMYYTDWAMEKFKFPFGGEMRQTSNWVPGQWSVRELYGADNYAMALAHFMCGQSEDGWGILQGTLKESMYGDLTPKSGYGNERCTFNHINLQSPGGLSHPNCGIDFNDIVTMFGRSVIEGLFGYLPDYPNGSVSFSPSFPEAWPYANIQTKDFVFDFKKQNNQLQYLVKIKTKANLHLTIPVWAGSIKSVNCNNKSIPYQLEAGYGKSLLKLSVNNVDTANIVVELANPRLFLKPIELKKEAGEAFSLPLNESATIEDPQNILKSIQLNKNKLSAVCTNDTGYHVFFIKYTQASKMPAYQMVKLHISNSRLKAFSFNKFPQNAGVGTFKTINIDSLLNGDIRNIFKYKYTSDRPATASCRIGYDGWSAWTFKWWNIKVPEIKLDSLGKYNWNTDFIKHQSGAIFKKPNTDANNIAFTSHYSNWPRQVNIPINDYAKEIWLLLIGSTNPMQLRIANAQIAVTYEDHTRDTLNLEPPNNFWALCRFGNLDYNYHRDGFSLPAVPPMQLQLGANCRAMVYGIKNTKTKKIKSISLTSLSQEVVIGLMAVSLLQ